MPDSDETGNRRRRILCALVIGHSRNRRGAQNAAQNLSEFEFNEDLAKRISQRVRDTDIQLVYRRTYETLPGDINALSPDFIVSLHCNSAERVATGTETLYYHTSETGKRVAEIMQDYLVQYLQLPDRGIKPRTVKQRGGKLLRRTEAPCVICEPFFINNDSDLARAQEDIDGLAEAYAAAIDRVTRDIFTV